MRIKKAWLGVLVLAMAFGLIAAAACGDDATPVVVEKEVIEVIKEVVVEKEVIKEVEVVKEVEVAAKGRQITGVPRSGGVILWGGCVDVETLHPHMTFSGNCDPGPISMYESLVEKDWTESRPENKSSGFPAGPFDVLAESHSLSDDRLTLTFNLRKGIKFQDGTDFNAQVVEMNFRTLIDEDYEFFNPRGSAFVGYTLSHIETVRAVDEFTFELILNKPFFGFIDKISSYPCCAIISGKGIEENTVDEISQGGPWGTGHFKFAEWERGQRLVIERWEDYRGEKALIDQLIMVPIIDEAARVAALLTGEIDIASAISPDNLVLIRNVEGLEGYSRGFWGFYGLEPNHKEPPFNDQRVRRAVSLCFDRDELANTLMKGVFSPGAQIWGAGHAGKDPDGRQITDAYNPELAKELLAEAGYPDGFQTKMYSSADGLAVPALVVNNYVVISLRECGIEVELVNFEWLTYLGFWLGGIKEGEGIGMFTMNMGTGDIAGYDQYLHSASWPPAGWSMGWYANDDVDALIEKAWNASSHEEYLQAERDAHELALDDYAYIPVLENALTFGVSDRVGGWTASSSWVSRFNKAFVEYER